MPSREKVYSLASMAADVAEVEFYFIRLRGTLKSDGGIVKFPPFPVAELQRTAPSASSDEAIHDAGISDVGSRCQLGRFGIQVRLAPAMSLLDWLLRRPPDPTVGWPAAVGVLPAIAFAPFRLGSLQLGERVDAAQFLGKPDKVTRYRHAGFFSLHYATWGMSLHFEDHVLVEVDFGLEPDSARMEGVKLTDGSRIDASTTPERLIDRFGEPTLNDVDVEHETQELQFKDSHNILEFEFDEGRLIYWCAYPLE